MNPRAIERPGRWEDLWRSFRWRIPPGFTISRACCDVWAEAEPDRVAIVHLGEAGVRAWSYGELKRASDRLSNAFRGRGIVRGDRVAILLPQCPEVMIAHFAAMK